MKIGVFDSGVGGLSVFHKIAEKYPFTNLIYLADTARLPYGDKSPAMLRQISEENTRFLLKMGCDRIVIACHSASAHAADWLRERFSVPIIDVITPSVKGAVKATKRGSIGVIGTRATIRSLIHERSLKAHCKEVNVFSQACPLLVPLVEECGPQHKAIDLFLEEYLTPFLQNPIDTLILGCTHYPFLKDKIQKILGDTVKIIDAGPLLAEELEKCHGSIQNVNYFVTDDCERFTKLAEKIDRKLLGPVERIALE